MNVNPSNQLCNVTFPPCNSTVFWDPSHLIWSTVVSPYQSLPRCPPCPSARIPSLLSPPLYFCIMLGFRSLLWYSPHPYLCRFTKQPFHLCFPTALPAVGTLGSQVPQTHLEPELFTVSSTCKSESRNPFSRTHHHLYPHSFPLQFATLWRPGESFLVGRQGMREGLFPQIIWHFDHTYSLSFLLTGPAFGN